MSGEDAEQENAPDRVARAGDSELLNWIVPARRAVVKGNLEYSRAVEAWINRLRTYSSAIRRWYFTSDEEPADGSADCMDALFESGRQFGNAFRTVAAIACVQIWKDRFFASAQDGQTVPVTPNSGDTVDEGHEYPVRLWKGPLRVLRDVARSSAGASAPPETCRVELNDSKEVVNADAVFLMGDVIEFPLHKYLSLCGLERFDNVEFNPRGHFLLGTSLKLGDESPPGSAILHDNLLAMRLQLAVNLGVGAFYSLQSTFDGTTAQDTHAAGSGDARVHSRGLLYGAVLLGPSQVRGNLYWRVFTQGWGFGVGSAAPENMPMGTSLSILADGTPLTPAWDCSPSALFLSFLLVDEYASGHESVNNEMTARNLADSPLRRYYSQAAISNVAESLRAGAEGDSWSGPRDFTSVLADLNSINVGAVGRGHEWLILKLYPPDKLMAEQDLPTIGYFSAYHPLSGADYFTDPNFRESGMLFYFEATGRLSRSPLPQRFEVKPFKWKAVPDNNLNVWYRRVGNQHNLKITDSTAEPGVTVGGFYTMPRAQLAGQYSSPRAFKPVVILHPQKRGTEYTATALPVGNYETICAERAVPFPTIAEATGQFPSKAEVAALDRPAAATTPAPAASAAAAGT